MDFLTQGGLQGSGARNPELTSLMSMLPDNNTTNPLYNLNFSSGFN
jgi:hypothetical protein